MNEYDIRVAQKVYKLFQQDPTAINCVDISLKEIDSIYKKTLNALIIEIRWLETELPVEVYLIFTKLKLKD